MANPTVEFLPGILDIWFVRGDDLLVHLEWTEGEGVDEQPKNVSDWVFKAQIRKTPQDKLVLAELAVDNTLAAVGEIDLASLAAVTAKFPPTNLAWDLERVVDGTKRTMLAGACKIKGDVTK